MNYVNRCVKGVSLIVTITLVMSGCVTFKKHPEFDDRHKEIRSLAAMMPDTTAYEITFNSGNIPLPEIQNLIQTTSHDKVISIFEGKGYDVKPIKYTKDSLEKDPVLQKAIFNINTLYSQAVADINKKKKKQFTYDIGSSANYFAEREGVNVLVLTRQVAAQLSDGVKTAKIARNSAALATALLVGVAIGADVRPDYHLITEISVIDADLGDILWYNLGGSTKNYTKADDVTPIHKMLDKILEAFPESKLKKAIVKKMTPSKPAAQKQFTPRSEEQRRADINNLIAGRYTRTIPPATPVAK